MRKNLKKALRKVNHAEAKVSVTELNYPKNFERVQKIMGVKDAVSKTLSNAGISSNPVENTGPEVSDQVQDT